MLTSWYGWDVAAVSISDFSKPKPEETAPAVAPRPLTPGWPYVISWIEGEVLREAGVRAKALANHFATHLTAQGFEPKITRNK